MGLKRGLLFKFASLENSSFGNDSRYKLVWRHVKRRIVYFCIGMSHFMNVVHVGNCVRKPLLDNNAVAVFTGKLNVT